MRRFLRLPAGERWLFLKASLLLWVVKLGLIVLPFESLRRYLDKLVRLPSGFSVSGQRSADRVVWAVELAGRLMPPASTCLTQALSAQVLLLRRGYPALVHIGTVRGEGGEFEAHAWVESGGEVVLGGHELERYTTLTVLGGASR